MLWAEAKQIAALDTYAAEHKLKLPPSSQVRGDLVRCFTVTLRGCYGRLGSNSSTLVAAQ